jgi:hypothetical protein
MDRKPRARTPEGQEELGQISQRKDGTGRERGRRVRKGGGGNERIEICLL